jgi:hypothetical protein
MGKRIDWDRLRRKQQVEKSGYQPISEDLPPLNKEDIRDLERKKASASAAAQAKSAESKKRSNQPFTPEYTLVPHDGYVRRKNRRAKALLNSATIKKVEKPQSNPVSGELYSGKINRMQNVTVEHRAIRKPEPKTEKD